MLPEIVTLTEQPKPDRRVILGAMSREAADFQRRLQFIKNPIERASLYMRNLHKFQSNS